MVEPPGQPRASGRILVIGGATADGAATRTQLERGGYTVTVAGSGTAGVAAASANPPDLILLDVDTPGIDGSDVCRRLREGESTQLTPIVMLTAAPGRAAMVDAVRIGADDFIARPFSADELVARVQADILRGRQREVQAPGPPEEQAEDLRDGIAHDQLVLYYQPKLAVADRQLVGASALVRWQHPTRGLLPPGAFVPLAERAGLIRDLTQSVLRGALRQCRVWAEAGHTVPVTVNFSTGDIQHVGTPLMVFKLLDASRVPPADLTLELTESAILADMVRSIEVLARLRGRGVQIAIDNFGAGHSSLGDLTQLPIDELKIDRSIIGQMVNDAGPQAGPQAIVRATVALAHDLGLRVVAEGVENQATCDLLAEIGCDVMQGYFLGLPAPAHELAF